MQVLVVEDDMGHLRMLERLLSQAQYEILTATDGVEAVSVFRENRPQLVIADWMLPAMDGLQLCKYVRSQPWSGYVYYMMMTGVSERSRVVEALDAGADGFLQKPIDPQELLARIRAAERIIQLEARLASDSGNSAERTHSPSAAAVAAADEFLGLIGHELRTPLAALRGMSEFLLSDDAREMNEFDLFLRNIHDEVLRMAGTVEQLLEAARINSGRAKWNWSLFGLQAVCEDALDSVRVLVDRAQVNVECAVIPPGTTMHGDADAIRRLILNLARNAQKHTCSGTIRVDVRTLHDSSEAWVQISVSDTGAGIAPEIADQLGDAFALNSGSVGTSQESGTGLGLAICKGIVAAHGGSMRIRSQEGQGTTVIVHLRAHLPEPASVPAMMTLGLSGRS
jgi:signal transduction histidine kinase